jgi:hypothetical protein
MLTVPPTTERRAAVVVAHPGHELRVHGWLERHRPIVFVLTDGSGGGAGSRLESTRRVVRNAGATEGSIFGRISDRDLYAAMMRGDQAFFIALADELAAAVVAADRDLVVCDAREGYNSAHDLCWYLVEAAVALASHAGGRRVTTLEFPLAGAPAQAAAVAVNGSVRLALDAAAFERKMAAAFAYPEMAGELQAALARFSADAFRVECLTPANHAVGAEYVPGAAPFYETYGEQQVAAGVYATVLREREHMMPLVTSLRQYVLQQTVCRLHSLSS